MITHTELVCVSETDGETERERVLNLFLQEKKRIDWLEGGGVAGAQSKLTVIHSLEHQLEARVLPHFILTRTLISIRT